MSHAIQITTANSNGVDSYHFAPGKNPIANLLARASVWRMRHTSRRELGRLNDNVLQDIGIDRAVANLEARKFFWQA